MSHTGDCEHFLGACVERIDLGDGNTFVHAGRVHTNMVLLIRDLITDSGRSPDEIATEAGVMPSHLRQVLNRSEVLTVDDVVGLGEALGVRASDLVRLAESRLGTEAVTER